MTVLLPEFQGVLDAACQSFRRVSLEGAGALCEGVGRQEANALDLFRDTIRIGLQDRLEIRNGRDDLFSDFGADAQFGEHGMRSVFGHLLAPRGEQGLGLFLADQIGKELARITAINNGNEVGTEFGRNFLAELWADPFELSSEA